MRRRMKIAKVQKMAAVAAENQRHAPTLQQGYEARSHGKLAFRAQHEVVPVQRLMDRGAPRFHQMTAPEKLNTSSPRSPRMR